MTQMFESEEAYLYPNPCTPRPEPAASPFFPDWFLFRGRSHSCSETVTFHLSQGSSVTSTTAWLFSVLGELVCAGWSCSARLAAACSPAGYSGCEHAATSGSLAALTTPLSPREKSSLSHLVLVWSLVRLSLSQACRVWFSLCGH